MKKWIVMMLCAAFVLVSVNAEPADSAAAEKNEAAAEQAEAKTAQQATAVKDGESKEKKEDLDELEKARQALQYGLESEILEVTGKIDKQDFETLQEDFNRLFADTKSPAVREGLFGLYQKYDNPYLTQAAEAVLEDYLRQQRTVIKASLSYLAAVKPELNTALSDAVKSLITEETADYGAEAVAVLGEIGGDDEAAFLAEYFENITLDDEKQELILKQTIASALEKLHRENTREFLLSLAQDENENVYVRSSAVAGLAQMGSPDTVPLLVEFFEQKEPLLREAAIRGISNFDTEETRKLMLQGFKDSNYKVRLEALKTVQKTKQQDAVPFILYRAKYDPTEAVKLAAVETLVLLNAPEGNAWLAETFCDTKKSEKLRVAILRAALKHNAAVIAGDLDTVVLATVTDKKYKTLRYEFGKEIAKAENSATSEICKAFLQSDDALTKSIGLDMFKTNHYADARALVEAIAQDEKQGTLQRRAQRLLGSQPLAESAL